MVSWYTIFFDVPSATTRGWTMADEVRISLDQIVRHFESLEDPRSTVNRRHPLISVVVIAMMGVLAGASGPTAIARWARLKEDLLEQSLDLPHGVPSKDVFLRVLATLKPGAFQACFASWLQSLRDDATAATGVEQPVLAFDGKTLRRSHDRKNGLGALHCVSVWASELGLTLGQVACEEKSNEITAIPQLLKLIDIKGAIITIDAMGTQKAIAAEIIEGEADYVLAVKGNQGTLFHSVVAHFNDQILAGLPRGTVQRHVTRQTGHGRQETRVYLLMAVPKTLADLALWKGLKSIGMVISKCIRNGKETIEHRYYISSLPVDAKVFARAVRNHWGIENACHWSLDVTYREDESRIRHDVLRQNFAWLYRFTLSLLKQHPGPESLAMKRRSCGWSDDFLIEVLTGKAC
jgi:predicted transposase YbfD/YdcC